MRRGLGLMSELAPVSVSAFPTNEFEAGFTDIEQPRSGHVLPY